MDKAERVYHYTQLNFTEEFALWAEYYGDKIQESLEKCQQMETKLLKWLWNYMVPHNKAMSCVFSSVKGPPPPSQN